MASMAASDDELGNALSEIEVYLSLGFVAEARAAYARLAERFGDHPALRRACKELGLQRLPLVPLEPMLGVGEPRIPAGEPPNDDTKAKRLARLVVSEIKLYREQRLASGHSTVESQEMLNEDIERGRQWYRRRLGSDPDHADDHFRDALVEFLAIGDAGFPEAEPKPAVAPIADSLRQPFLRFAAILKRVLPAWHRAKARSDAMRLDIRPEQGPAVPELSFDDQEFIAEHLAEGRVYIQYGLADKARECFMAVLRRFPDNVQALGELVEVSKGKATDDH